jgi:hypothetical protein
VVYVVVGVWVGGWEGGRGERERENMTVLVSLPEGTMKS